MSGFKMPAGLFVGWREICDNFFQPKIFIPDEWILTILFRFREATFRKNIQRNVSKKNPGPETLYRKSVSNTTFLNLILEGDT